MKTSTRVFIRNLLAFSLAMVMFLSLLTGCQVGTTTDKKEAPTTVSSLDIKDNFNPTGYPIVNEEITVTSMISEADMYIPDDPDEVLYWKKARELTNIRVEWDFVEADTTVINLYFTTGDFPDFFVKHLTPDIIYQHGVVGNAFLDLSDMIYKYMPHLVSRFKEYPDMENAIKELDGKIYTLPTFRGGTTSTGGIMHYRKDYFERLNLSVPKTIDDYYDVLKAIKESGLTEGHAPYCPYYASLSQAEDYFFPAFGNAYQTAYADDGSGNVIYNRVSDQYKRFLEYMNKLYKDGLLENEYLSLDGATKNVRVKNGYTALAHNFSTLFPEDFLDGKMGIGCLDPLVSEYTSEKKALGYAHILVAAGGVNAKSKYPEAILRFLDMAYAKEEVAPGTGLDGEAVNNGINGITFEIDEATNTKYFLVPPEYSDMPFYSWLRKYHGWNVWYGVLDNMYFNSDANAGARERSREAAIRPYEKPRLYDNHFKYTPDEKASIATKLTDIDNYVDEMKSKFVAGIEPFSKWDDFVNTVEKMGLKDVLEVKQKGYERWLGK